MLSAVHFETTGTWGAYPCAGLIDFRSMISVTCPRLGYSDVSQTGTPLIHHLLTSEHLLLNGYHDFSQLAIKKQESLSQNSAFFSAVRTAAPPPVATTPTIGRGRGKGGAPNACPKPTVASSAAPAATAPVAPVGRGMEDTEEMSTARDYTQVPKCLGMVKV